MNNLKGERFGRLIALEDSGIRCGGNVVWKCVCDCGKLTKVIGNNLKTGQVKSCGCLRQDITKKRAYKHGHCCANLISRLYRIWANMKTRCYNSNDSHFHRYGSRGIKVCDEWRNNYEAFRFWAILNGYQDNLTIDRIDNDGNYEPINCQFITLSENIKKGRN